ncbi:tubulin-tyrosine ligase [Favolaschia claudopus]|uniref:Tubulin-tyrosine ligase n=1 Tax=Favolaschia claudopus TaxID=2862362 RepID=A0AAW0EIB9_9AGAR
MFNAFVSWPTAPVTRSLVMKALEPMSPEIVASPSSHSDLLMWSTYDDIDHELLHSQRDIVLASSYTFRKALIRKHFLSRCLHAYQLKHPDTELKNASPKTFEIELSFADELEELLLDELWELGKDLDDVDKWWILKPGMADRGNGIRLFNTKAALEKIFEEFEEDDSDDAGNESEEVQDTTAVVTSQLRHFVIQEYLSNPMLIDPREVPVNGASPPDELHGYKFHLRAYCVAQGALKVFLFDKVLALFSAVPYEHPNPEEDEDGDPLPIDLGPHLTNTSLQAAERGEAGVRLLSELMSCRIMSGSGDAESQFSSEDLQSILDQIRDVLAETFKAALDNPIHFQPIPNAFELFGIDFLVTDNPERQRRFQVALLEVNSEPAIELTGPRLSWILQDLFVAIGEVCVKPFFKPESELRESEWAVGDTRQGLIKCLDYHVRPL